MLKNKKKKGFTLIELIVVIAILGILAAVLIPRFTGFQKSAGHSAVLADAKNISAAFEAIHAEDSAWPTTEQEVWDYIGKDLGGTIDFAPDVNTLFTYTNMAGGESYTATYTTTGNLSVTP